jgi:hypothetical protein
VHQFPAVIDSNKGSLATDPQKLKAIQEKMRLHIRERGWFPNFSFFIKIFFEIQLNLPHPGAETIQGLGRHFRILDDNRDNGIDGFETLPAFPESLILFFFFFLFSSEREFAKAIREYGFNMSDDDVRFLFKSYDTNGDGSLSYEEFLAGVRVSCRIIDCFPHLFFFSLAEG